METKVNLQEIIDNRISKLNEIREKGIDPFPHNFKTTHSISDVLKNKDSLFLDEEIAIYKGPTLVNSKILISNQKGIISVINANNGTETDILKVDELASLVTWLAAEENSFPTAAVFDLSGGRATY